jgi:uncharacterized membrane protein
MYISNYAQQVTSLKERVFEISRDITDDYIESQKEIINLFNHSLWTPRIENVGNRTSGLSGVFSQSRAEVYCNTFNKVVGSFVTDTRLANQTIFANAERINTSLQQTRNNVREFSELGVNAAKIFIRLQANSPR